MCDHNFPGKVCLPDPAFLGGEPVITLDANNGDVFIGGPGGGFGHRGRLVITDSDANPTITIDGATGEITQSGDIVLLDNAGNERVRITGQGAEIIFMNAAGTPVLRAGSQGDLQAGGGGQDGDIVVRNATGTDTILMNGDEGDIVIQRDIGGNLREVFKLDASHAALYVGCEGNEGDIIVRDGNGNEVFRFDANFAVLNLGATGNEGDLRIRNNAGQNSFQVDGNEGDVIIRRDIGGNLREVFKLDASHAALYVGCEGNEGDIIVRDGAGNEVFRFDANFAVLDLGASGNEGDLRIRNNAGQNSFQVDGNEGDIFVRRDIGGNLREVMKFDASHAALYLGCEGNEGDLIVRDGDGNTRIHLDGASGDIQLHGADCAEEFEVRGPETIAAGTVLVIDDEGHLRPCSEAYDKKVAGVVSGGNGNNPGIVLGKTPEARRRLPVALNGKVYCMVDADQAAIEVGDMLTTSPTPGHAMKASDRALAFGSVLGKALSRIDGGTGLIPVLVALQ
jgi:hypothetical protein